MAKTPRQPPTDRPPMSDARLRGIRPWNPASPALPQQPVVIHEKVDVPNSVTRKGDALGPSPPATDSGKLLLSHVGNPATSFLSEQAMARSRQPQMNTASGSNAHQLPRATPTANVSMATANVSIAAPTITGESFISSASSNQASAFDERTSNSSQRASQIPTVPRSDRQALSKEEEELAKREARARRFEDVQQAQARSTDAARRQSERTSQQSALGQSQRNSHDQAWSLRDPLSNAWSQSSGNQRVPSSSVGNTAFGPDGWPLATYPQATATQTFVYDAQHSNTQHVAPTLYTGQDQLRRDQTSWQPAFGGVQNPQPFSTSHDGPSLGGPSFALNPINDSHRNFGSSSMVAPTSTCRNGQEIHEEEAQMAIVYDIPSTEESTIVASQGQKPPSSHRLDAEDETGGDIEMEVRPRRQSTPLTPCTSEYGDLPGDSDGATKMRKRSKAAKAPDGSSKADRGTLTGASEEGVQAVTPRPMPSRVEPEEPEELLHNPASPPPKSLALPAVIGPQDNLDVHVLSLPESVSNITEPTIAEGNASDISGRKSSKRSTRTANRASKVVFDDIATSNIIAPLNSDRVWSAKRVTRGDAKSNTQPIDTAPDAARAVEQKPSVISAKIAVPSTTILKPQRMPKPGRGYEIHTDLLQPDGTFELVAIGGVPVTDAAVLPVQAETPPFGAGNLILSETRSLRSRNPSKTPMRDPNTAFEAREKSHGDPASSSSSKPRPNSNSKRKTPTILESGNGKAQQGPMMEHVSEEPAATGSRTVPTSKRKPSNVHKQSASRHILERTSDLSASNGVLDRDTVMPSAPDDFTGQISHSARARSGPSVVAGPSTTSRLSARKKAKVTDQELGGHPDSSFSSQTIDQPIADVANVSGSAAEGQSNHVTFSVENQEVSSPNMTGRAKNDTLNGSLQQIDEALALQKERATAFMRKMQEAQVTKRKSLEAMELQMREMIEKHKQQMFEQDLALFTEQQQLLAQNEQTFMKLREELMSSATRQPIPKMRKKPVTPRSEMMLDERHQPPVRLPDELASSVPTHPNSRAQKKQVSSRQELLATTIQETDQRRVSNKKRKADRDGDYADGDIAYPSGKSKKKKKDDDEERHRPDVTEGDSRPLRRGKKDATIPEVNIALSNGDIEQLLEQDSSEQDRQGKQTAEAIRLSLIDKTEEVQMGDCTMARYDGFQRCRDCAVPAVTGSCRFKGWRVFPLIPKTGQVADTPWFDHQTTENETLNFPSQLNKEFSVQQSFRMKETVVKALLPVITNELLHCVRHGAKRKAHDIASRATCDRCSMTIFGGSWSCLCCGKEYCFECEPDMPENPTIKADPPKEGSSEDRLLSCGQGLHSRKLLFATTTFDLNVLQYHWLQMVGFAERAGISYDKQDVKQLLPYDNVSGVLFPTIELEVYQPGQQEERERARATDAVTDETLKGYLTTQSHDSHDLPPEATEQFPSHAFYRIDASKLDEPIFDRMWRDGIPIVIDNAQSYLQEDWSPKGFQTLFGEEKCTVYDCQAEIGEDSTISKFFGLFDSKSDRDNHKVLKLKDWPTNAEFKERCPSLNGDFHNTLPVPDYTRRDGVTNVSAFFPINTNPPDIGPKLYAALRGIETEGGKGSTRMHMDIADAINVMTYASKRDDGKQGCAVWHIYRKDDLDKIRAFLREKFAAVHQFVDPVHSQLFYLDSTLRQELFDKTGVFAHRIYQYPGQAVMIPAYCAHQVCNHSDCIKIACDFVSPHSITRCAQLTQEFRGENIVSDWKDDVLQLNSMMWYTWLFCSQYDAMHHHASALPFNEETVGTFIDEKSKSTPGQTGLADLKPSRPTASRLPQAKLKSLTQSPFWAKPSRLPPKPAPILPPRRLNHLPKLVAPSAALPIDALHRPTEGSAITTITGLQSQQSIAIVVHDPQSSNFNEHQSNGTKAHCAPASSGILSDVETVHLPERRDDAHMALAVADDVASALIPPVESSLKHSVVN